jgi:hypothetical protein
MYMSIAPMDFQFISLTIEKLQAWADKNNVDLSAEIASTKAKVKHFYSHSEGKSLSRKQKRSYKLNSTDVIVKSSMDFPQSHRHSAPTTPCMRLCTGRFTKSDEA